MMMKRRQFVATGSALLAATGLAPVRLFAESTEALDIRVVGFAGGLSQIKFKSLLNQTFYIRDETLGTVFAQLVAVKNTDGPVNLEQFSIYFQTPAVPKLPAGLYQVEHYLAGVTPLYLEPVSGLGTAPLYRADFSLLH
jgi:hypothetical protein